MTVSTRSGVNTRTCRWSSQFGLYKYREPNSEHRRCQKKNESSCRRHFRFFLIITMLSIAAVVACLMVFDFSTALDNALFDESTGKFRLGRNINDNDTFENHLPEQLPFQSETDVKITKQNISHLESTITTFINYTDTDLDPKPSEIKSISERVFRSKNGDSKSLINDNKNPPPSPFHKSDVISTSLSFPQLSNYKNSDRVRNLEELIRYMNNQFQKTDAKLPNSNRRMKFSGIYLHPREPEEELDIYNRGQTKDKSIEDKNNPSGFKRTPGSNNVDPFYPYKPNQPGDINLLAERKFRFAPNPQPIRLNHYKNKYPSKYDHNFNTGNINPSDFFDSDSEASLDVEDYDVDDHFDNKPAINRIRGHSKKRPLSVMLDIYPMENQDEETMEFPEHLKEPTTTRRPRTKYKPKPYFSPSYYPYGAPSEANYNYYGNYPHYNPNYYLYNRFGQQSNKIPFYPQTIPLNYPGNAIHTKKTGLPSNNKSGENVPTQMLVHLNLYPRRKIIKQIKFGEDTYGVIDRQSKEDDEDSFNSELQNVAKNINQNDTQMGEDLKTTLIDAMIDKYNKNSGVISARKDRDNITIEDIQNGYGFELPGPKLLKYDLPGGMSRSAVQLLSLSRNSNLMDKIASKTREGRSDESLIPSNITKPKIDKIKEIDGFQLSLSTSNDSGLFSYNASKSLDEFVAVPLIDLK